MPQCSLLTQNGNRGPANKAHWMWSPSDSSDMHGVCIWPLRRPPHLQHQPECLLTMQLPGSIAFGHFWTGTNVDGMRSDRWSRGQIIDRQAKCSCGQLPGVEAGPFAALLPALDGWHSLGLWGGVPQAAPGSAGHTGMCLHPCIMLITWLF